MNPLVSDETHHVLESLDMQLVIHAIPPHIANTFEIENPPKLRDDQAIKLFFTAPSLDEAETKAAQMGGGIFGLIYEGPGFKARNSFDPEGNIFHLRESAP